MSKRKYFCGKRLLSVSDFDQSESLYFMVNFGGKYPKTVHRAFLISWQYRTLMNFIVNGRIWEALDGVPSAQTEIIRCKDCRWWDKYSETRGGDDARTD